MYFSTPGTFRLDSVEQVRRRLEQPNGMRAVWRVNDEGAFERLG
jgi:hypothetical protein